MIKVSLLRAAQRRSQSWKNGGGTTQEIASYPEDSSLDDFGWRLSIADVSESGGFSVFPGVDRHLAILAGSMAFDIDDIVGRPRTPTDDALTFPGDVPVSGRLLAGPVQDLNLMVRRGAYRGRLRASQGAWITCAADLTIIVATKAGALIVDDREYSLSAFDGAMIKGPACLHYAELWGWVAEIWEDRGEASR